MEKRARSLWPIMIILVVLSLVSIAAPRTLNSELDHLIGWIAAQSWQGQLIFIAGLILACITGVIPASVLIISAGTVYGPVNSFILSVIGLYSSAIISFVVARHLFRKRLRPWIENHISLIQFDNDIAYHGWKFVALLRLCPVAPFGITSYMLGLTRLRFLDYLIGTIGSLPALLGYIYMGTVAREALRISIDHRMTFANIVFLLLSVITLALLGIYFYRLMNYNRLLSRWLKSEARPTDLDV